MRRFDRPPEIDYLARDFASFRQLMLDQIALIAPDWQERHPADLGMTLVELLAYAADYLSYSQDSLATESYLGTARLRRSIRRHARLLDYRLGNGCNARTWVHIRLKEGEPDRTLPKGARLLAAPRLDGRGAGLAPAEALGVAQGGSARVFMTLHETHLCAELPEVAFSTEDQERPALPRGATTALLRDEPLGRRAGHYALDSLRPGDALIFEQRLDAETGLRAGVDPTRRHAVRVLKVERLPPAAGQGGRRVVRITWDAADALPFDLPIGPISGERELSVALRNIALADHGDLVEREELPAPPPVNRYRPALAATNVTFAAWYEHADAVRGPASEAITQDPAAARAVVELLEVHRGAGGSSPGDGRDEPPAHRWQQGRDLLSSDRTARSFVVETEDDGRAYLRFGFGNVGRAPTVGSRYFARYRTGNGTQGNVGRDAIAYLVTEDAALREAVAVVRNPLPVTSGIDPEPIESARESAPYAFRAAQSCIHAEDYARLAEELPCGLVREARCRIEQTGNWPTVCVYVRRPGDLPVDAAFRARLLAWLRPRAMAGYEVAIRPARAVGLSLRVRVTAAPGRFRSEVREAVRAALGARVQDDGTAGFFHPDNHGFGRPVYASQVIRAAMAADGVARVDIVRFGRLDDNRGLDPVPVDELEVARLDAGPEQPERGLRIDMEGGL